MIEIIGNLWEHPANFRVITTNGSIRKDGCAVMGRGCAKEAATLFPALPAELGLKLQKLGNRVHFFPTYKLFTFPVKHEWFQKADHALIFDSTAQLARQLNHGATYIMPRPGCGNGGLLWVDVKPIISILPDNVLVVTFAVAM